MGKSLLVRLISRAIAKRLVTLPARRAAEFRLSVNGSRVTLPKNLDTVLGGNPGLYSLRFYEKGSRAQHAGHAILAEIRSQDKHQVERELLGPIVGNPSMATQGWVSGWLGIFPEHFDRQINRIELVAPHGEQINDSTLGNSAKTWRLPCWLLETETPSEDWVIHVHGRTATPAETARNFAFFRQQRFNNLSISYRGDSEAGFVDAKSKHHRKAMGLGTTEWPDVEAAVQFVISRGARRILLFGWSYGAAICLQFNRHSPLSGKVAGYIFDSPVISWRSTLKMQLSLNKMPPSLCASVEDILQDASESAKLGLNEPIVFEQFEPQTQAAYVAKPTLILHSRDDGYIPIEPSIELARFCPTLVQLVEFENARHCKLANFDEAKYQNALREFISSKI